MNDVMLQLESPDGGHFYDHEADSDLGLGRRRAVADWGADDLFDHAPRRRRSFAGAAARERRISGPQGGEGSVRHLEEVNRERTMRRLEREAAEGEHAGAVVTRIQDAPSYVADMPVDPVEAHEAIAATSERAGVESQGRRTVQIDGRPEPLPVARPRRRPERSVEERVGSRPDRIAGWAVALGGILIFMAVSTADAAPL